MHPATTVDAVLDLSSQGRSASEIARVTGLSRSTIRGWIAGAPPHSARASRGGCPTCGGAHDVTAVAADYAYLLGVYLGDGCIAAHPRGVFKLRLSLDAKYPAIIDGCCRAVSAIMPQNKVGQVARSGGFENSATGSNVEVYSYSKAWPCVFPQHGPGRKHERPIELADWQQRVAEVHPEQLLRGLIHSDGCRGMNTGRNWRYPRYSFSNRSADILRIFCETCDRLGVHWTKAPHTIYVSRVADVTRLDEFIGPKA
jgi:hypothetical protein